MSVHDFIIRYYEGLQKCVGLYLEDGKYSPDQIDRLVSLYETLGRQYKWSSAVKVMQSLLLLLVIYTFCIISFLKILTHQ